LTKKSAFIAKPFSPHQGKTFPGICQEKSISQKNHLSRQASVTRVVVVVATATATATSSTSCRVPPMVGPLVEHGAAGAAARASGKASL